MSCIIILLMFSLLMRFHRGHTGLTAYGKNSWTTIYLACWLIPYQSIGRALPAFSPYWLATFDFPVLEGGDSKASVWTLEAEQRGAQQSLEITYLPHHHIKEFRPVSSWVCIISISVPWSRCGCSSGVPCCRKRNSVRLGSPPFQNVNLISFTFSASYLQMGCSLKWEGVLWNVSLVCSVIFFLILWWLVSDDQHNSRSLYSDFWSSYRPIW